MIPVTIACPELKATIEKLKALGGECPKAVKRGMQLWGEEVAADSKNNRVPVDMGALKSTINAQTTLKDGVTTLTIGAGGPTGPGYSPSEDVGYAVIVHENPRAGKTGGKSPSGKPYKHWAKTGGWKYLENPIKERLPILDATVAVEIGKEIAKVKA